MNPKPLCITRRGALIWLSVVLAAPFVTRKGGILMPIRNRTLLNTRELELLKEVQEWRQSITRLTESRICASWTGEGWTHIGSMAEAEKRFKAMGFV